MSIHSKVKVEIFESTRYWLDELVSVTGKSELELFDEMVKEYVIFTLGNEKARDIIEKVRKKGR